MNTKIEAIAKYLEVEDDDIVEDGNIFSVSGGKREYLVLTEEEANQMAKEYILESAWAYNKSFLEGHSKVISKMPDKAFSVLQESCESANDAILAMIEDQDYFVEDAILSDGRGHFLSTYDGKEVEQDGYYIYRIN